MRTAGALRSPARYSLTCASLIRTRAKAAFGLATKKFAGSPTATDSRLVLYAALKASVLAMLPTLLAVRLTDECGARISAGSRHCCSACTGNAKEPIENRRGHTAGAARRKACTATSGEILLGVEEFLQETIFEDVDFVNVLRAPRVRSTIAAVSDFESSIFEDLSLDTETKLMHIRTAEIWIDRPKTVSRIQQEVFSIGDRDLECRCSRVAHLLRPSTPTRFAVCGLALLSDERLAVAISPGLVVPVPKEVSERGDAIMQIADGVTGTDRTRTFIPK